MRERLCALRATLGWDGESLGAARGEKMMDAKLC